VPQWGPTSKNAALLSPGHQPASMTRSVERQPWETPVPSARVPVRDGETSPMVTLEGATLDRSTLEPPTRERPTLEHPTLENPTREHASGGRRRSIPTTTLRSEPPPRLLPEPEVSEVIPRRSPWLVTAGLLGLLGAAGAAVAILHKGAADANTEGRGSATLPQPTTSSAPTSQAIVPVPVIALSGPPATSLSEAMPVPPPSSVTRAAPAAPTHKRPAVAKPTTAASESTTNPPPNPYPH
jgi:hypothetical protein